MSQRYMFRSTSEIVALSRYGMVAAARKIFDEMLERDTIAWNAMLTSYSQLGLAQQALSLFSNMRFAGVTPDDFTFTAALSVCSNAGNLNYGRKLHTLVVTSGYQHSLPISNSLIDLYGKCMCPSYAAKIFNCMSIRNEVSWCSMLHAYAKSGEFDDAHKLFDDMPIRNCIAWNILIAGHSRHGEFGLCMDFIKQMQNNNCRGDSWTFSSLMDVCAKSMEPNHGSALHACIIKSGWDLATETKNSILSFYIELGRHEDAVQVFESMAYRTQVSWNTMIDAYMRIGDMCKALILFWEAPQRNIVSWTTMIGGYARNGHGESALTFFTYMFRSCHQPDEFAFGVVLLACANLAFLGHGRMIHGCVIHYGLPCHVYVGNALVNMYSKCGDVDGLSRAFSEIRTKDVVSWNEIIFGFALHGQAEKAFDIHKDMLRSGVKPDKLTFIGLLMACSHSGLIETGIALLKSMNRVHGLKWEEDHVACVVDMLGRGGYTEAATKVIEDYSGWTGCRPSLSFKALLGACSVHGDLRLGKKVSEDLLTVDPSNEMGYMLLSNLYSASAEWKGAEIVRKAMVEKGLKRKPGCSWIQVINCVMVFVAGDLTHPCMDVVCKILELLKYEMRYQSYLTFDKVF
ncbi:pentatricopeptide repeat-containing protein At2g36980, mitochondrial [Aristolochia californica]|uniref:pentatricopeptide repeat-containing protein At2g36980, mitochondrial n=1 Tax=Aristolochia californica TaxID=171875 RepID=UPI0035DF3019